MSGLAIESALSALQSRHSNDRVEAALQLGASQAIDALAPLIAALDDPAPIVQQAASQALGQLCPLALQAVLDSPTTKGVLRSAVTALANRARTGQGNISPALLGSEFQVLVSDIPALVSALHTSQPTATQLAMTLLSKTGSESAVAPLLRELTSPNDGSRCEAARGLGQLGFATAVDPLMCVFPDASLAVQVEVVIALGKLKSPATLPLLIKAMADHDDVKLRRAVGQALVKFGDVAVPHLKEALPEFNEPTRLRLVEVLSSMGTPEATALLLNLLRDESEAVRYVAIKAFYFARQTSTLAAVRQSLDDASQRIRIEALKITSDDVESLQVALHNSSAEVQIQAAIYLQRIDSPAATSALLTGLFDAELEVRLSVAVALAAQSDVRAVAAVEPLIEIIDALRKNLAGDLDSITAALAALGEFRDASPLVGPYLRAGLKDADPLFRYQIVLLFESLADRRFTPELLLAAADPNPSVAAAAADGLRELKGLQSQRAKAARSMRLEKLCKVNSSWISNEQAAAPTPPPPASQVSFSLAAPALLVPKQAFVLSVWAHLPEETEQAFAMAQRSYPQDGLLIHTKAGTEIALGAELTVRLSVPGLDVVDPEDTLIWRGSIANASFPVAVPAAAAAGSYTGMVTIHALGIRVAKLHFVLTVSASGPAAHTPEALPAKTERHRTAFASYASADRDDVLSRVQGMLKVMPQLDIFVDVVTLRAGQRWADRLVEEIKQRDVFYLFWSQAAKASEWVEKEWRMALDMRGIDYIDPVPMIAPNLVPPPKELADQLHFNDWVLAFLRGKT